MTAAAAEARRVHALRASFFAGGLDRCETISYYIVVNGEQYYSRRREMNSQYKKGVLELCVLSLLGRGDRYGYEIAERLSRSIDIADGTVYPILRKLKGEGLLTTYLQEESGGPPRKYYKLTSLGREEYERERADYLNFAAEVQKLLEDEKNDEE